MSQLHLDGLSSLPQATLDLLRPSFKNVVLAQGHVIYEAGEPITMCYFLETAVVSLVVPLSNGNAIEAAMIGPRGIVGGSIILDDPISFCQAIVQVAGKAAAVSAEALHHAADASPALRSLLMRQQRAILIESQQSVACNVTHHIESRLARWLLHVRDLCGTDTLQLTQEFLAEMLGVRRTSVTIEAHTLQQAGFIAYKRGWVQILNLEGLQETACECYEAVRQNRQRLLGGHAHAASAEARATPK
jgi:CRP-like cAMP-binding protein